MSDDRKMNKASSDLKKLRQAEDGRKALLDYESEAAATRAKTERLRVLRLEAEAAAPKAVPPKKKPAKASKAKAQPLSEWMSNQKKDGIRD